MPETTQASTPTLTIDETGRATIMLNRPRHLNRLHREDLLALRDHLQRLRTAPGVRVLVLTATGRAFCAGFNLDELGQDDAALQGPQLFEHTVDALEALPLPTVARLNGSVYGGAVDLALACDFRVGVQGMELHMPAARLGLHYYPSGLQRCVSRLGLAAAKRLFLQAPTLGADELLRIGYLDAAPPPEALDAEVDAVVASLLAGAPLAVAGMKQSLNEIARGEFNVGPMREREAACAASADLREGLTAFKERRTPCFSGR
jgi:enoyl-CoA hydratase/carnithine racemase